MRTTDENYQALKKCVIQDFPYDVVWNDDLIYPIFEDVYRNLILDHANINNSYYSHYGQGIVDLGYLNHYVLLCYRFSRALWVSHMTEYAEVVYYSLRIRGNIDLYYKADIGPYFLITHAIGTCLDAHATYGKGFHIYNGCHIGPFRIVGKEPSEWEHPSFGDWVTMLSGSKVYGSSRIGNNVIISVNTVIINEEIPDNCIVSGVSPNLYFQKLKTPNSSILRQ